MKKFLVILFVTLQLSPSAVRPAEQFIESMFGYFVYFPANYDQTKKYDILVMLHGLSIEYISAGKMVENFIPLADKHGFVIASRASADRESVQSLINVMGANSKIFIGGFSAGGREAIAFAGENPDLVKGHMIHSPGNLDDQLRIIKFKPGSEQIPSFFTCGTRDGRIGSIKYAVMRLQERFPGQQSYFWDVGQDHYLSPKVMAADIKFMQSVNNQTYQPSPIITAK